MDIRLDATRMKKLITENGLVYSETERHAVIDFCSLHSTCISGITFNVVLKQGKQ